jgi:nitroreductase
MIPERRMEGKNHLYCKLAATPVTGQAAPNAQLKAVALSLGSVVLGTLNDDDAKRVLALDNYEQPLCPMPVGKLRR